MVLGALAALLEIEPDIEVVARARDGREALALAEKTDPDVVLDRHRDAGDDRPRAGGGSWCGGARARARGSSS